MIIHRIVLICNDTGRSDSFSGIYEIYSQGKDSSCILLNIKIFFINVFPYIILDSLIRILVTNNSGSTRVNLADCFQQTVRRKHPNTETSGVLTEIKIFIGITLQHAKYNLRISASMKLKETKLIQYRKIDYGIISGNLHCIISGGMSTSHGSGSKETSMFISFIQENNVNISDNFSFVFQSR